MRVRAIAKSLPYKKFPPRLIAEMVYNVIFWLNGFPPSYWVHSTISPRKFIAGLAIDHNKHCRLKFGAYIQVHEQGDD